MRSFIFELNGKKAQKSALLAENCRDRHLKRRPILMGAWRAACTGLVP